MDVPLFTSKFYTQFWFRQYEDEPKGRFELVDGSVVDEHHLDSVLRRVAQEFAYVNTRFWFDVVYKDEASIHRIYAVPQYGAEKCPSHLWIPDALCDRKRRFRRQTMTPTLESGHVPQEHYLPYHARRTMATSSRRVCLYPKY